MCRCFNCHKDGGVGVSCIYWLSGLLIEATSSHENEGLLNKLVKEKMQWQTTCLKIEWFNYRNLRNLKEEKFFIPFFFLIKGTVLQIQPVCNKKMKFLLFRWVSMGNGWLSVPSKKSQCIEPPPSQVIPCAAEDSGGRWQRDIEILNLQHSQL